MYKLIVFMLFMTYQFAFAQTKGGAGKGDTRQISNENIYLSDLLFTGAINTDFTLGSNWLDGTFPSSGIGVVPSTATQQPVLSGTHTIGAGTTIIIAEGASLTVTPTGVLTVGGTLDNFGTLTLQSDATGSASIGPSSGTILGNINVQRHIPAMASPSASNNYGRRWRFISSPVQNSTFEDVRQEMFVTGPGTGTVVGTINSNGFDATHSNPTSVFGYDEAVSGSQNNGWQAVTHINTPLDIGKGYRILVRGDRVDTSRISRNTTTPQNAVTIDFRGEVNQGNISMPVLFTSSGKDEEDGWNFLGNPYPSAIDWDLIHDDGRTGTGPDFSGNHYTNIEETAWIWNPTSNNYGTYNALSNIGTNGFNGIIASGQGFWVKSTQASTSLTLTENHKTSSITGLFKNTKNSAFYIQLLRDSFNRDELAVKYVYGATTMYDAYDSRMMGSSVSISAWDADSVDLSISCRPVNTTSNDTIRLNVQGASGNYILGFRNSDQIAVQEHVTLVDAFLNTYTDLRQQISYPFAINASNAATHGRNRFYIVVSNNNPVPVELLSLQAQKLGDEEVQITWQSAAEVNFSHYDLEKSEDGSLFVQIDTQKGRGNKAVGGRYISIDKNPNTTNYYRLKMVDRDGSYKYSHVVVVQMDKIPQVLSTVFPNPSMGSIVIRTKAGSDYRLVDIQGRTIRQGTADAEMHWQNMEQGVYILQLHEQGQAPQSIKIVITHP